MNKQINRLANLTAPFSVYSAKVGLIYFNDKTVDLSL